MSQENGRPDRAWMVRAGNDNELIDPFIEHNVIAVGWAEMGDLSTVNDREEMKACYRDAYPDNSSKRVGINAGQIYKFALEIDEGDLVISYEKSSRTYIVGVVSSAYKYNEDVISDYPHLRQVDWLEDNGKPTHIDRDELTQKARNSLGSTLTIFNLDSYVNEIYSLARGEKVEEPEEESEETPPFLDEVQSQSDELISDLITELDPYDFEDLVAEVLRAMGFQAKTTPKGPDQGIDIVAHPDQFGFEDPIIKVQVKHRQSSSGIDEIQRFVGALNPQEKGIFVSSGGFTREAEKEVNRTEKRVTLYDRSEFVDLMKDHYEHIDSEYKALVPLRKVWIPAE